MQTIETVAVLGASEAGTACALLAALAGCTVRLHDPDDAALGAGSDALRGRVELGMAQGALTATERQRILDGVLFTPELDDALTGADLVIDAGRLPPPAARVGESLRATAVVAAAGATPPAALVAALPQPGRVVALRLAASDAPLPRVEVEPTPGTTGHVLERARAFAARANLAARAPAAIPSAAAQGGAGAREPRSP